MLGELASVVCCDGQGILFERFKEFDDGHGDIVGILAVCELFHEQESGFALSDGEDEVLAVLYEVHLEVLELLPALHVVQPLVYRHPARDVPHAGPHASFSVLEPVPAVPVELSRRSSCRP